MLKTLTKIVLLLIPLTGLADVNSIDTDIKLQVDQEIAIISNDTNNRPCISIMAANRIIKLGPAVESYILEILLDKNVNDKARIGAVLILGEIGTTNSIKPLQDIASVKVPSELSHYSSRSLRMISTPSIRDGKLYAGQKGRIINLRHDCETGDYKL